MECQNLVKPQDCSEVSSRKERPDLLKRMGRRVAGPGKGIQYSRYLKWKMNNPEEYEDAKEKKRLWRLKTIKESPWWKHYASVEHRCKYDHWYYNNGVKSFLTVNDIKEIWLRDSAEKMNDPQLDRINSEGDYTTNNTRFIERLDNQRRRKTNNDLKVYRLYKEGKSISDICKIMNFKPSTVIQYIGEIKKHGRANHKPWDNTPRPT